MFGVHHNKGNIPNFISDCYLNYYTPNAGKPAGLTNIQMMFDTPPCVLKRVVGYRKDGVPYADF
jgi:hypothetical protein